MVSVIESAIWAAQNIQFIVAALLGIIAIAFSFLALYILHWIFTRILLPFWWRPSADKKKSNTSRGKSATKRTKKKTTIARRWTDGLMAGLGTALGTGLVLFATLSVGVCAYSLTSQGCQSLRQLGLIELLPWKAGLRCYRTRWDWMADIVGEVIMVFLRGSEFPINISS